MLATMTEPVLHNAETPYNSLDYLKDLLGNDANAVNDILNEIKVQWQEDRLHLGQAVAATDLEEVKRLLHRIKSTFSPLGPGHVLYLGVVTNGESFLEKRGSLSGDQDYWQKFMEDTEQMVGALPKEAH
ncbi:hypothetical protein [Niabella drilacis]|uniref:HPt domain-containing protein n=1 Tax=Niabella drilacis (strain DSM 25811 / CCM 8410 / CCUG 62505 / LMG 26954 / E90) TaxID=1285928 RepID=A0A1G7BQ03_NIADE|nr:hypothetical protein [Niabella drilacis]SDE29218.1 hypothetical protein SAMN04487894_13211 [Niabella drilacis]